MPSRLTSTLLIALLTVSGATGSLACALNCASGSSHQSVASSDHDAGPDATVMPSHHHAAMAMTTHDVFPSTISTPMCHAAGITCSAPVTCTQLSQLRGAQLALRAAAAAGANPASNSSGPVADE